MCKLLTISDVSKLMQLHKWTVIRYIRLGAVVGNKNVKLKASLLGRGWRIRPEELDKFIKATQIK